MEKQKSKQHQIKIELDDNVGQGEYVNLAIVTHSPAEFVMDFIRVLPGMTKSKVKSRIIMAPMHAKTLMMALNDLRQLGFWLMNRRWPEKSEMVEPAMKRQLRLEQIKKETHDE